jgi:hypothetical protein
MPEVSADCGAIADTDGDGAGKMTERIEVGKILRIRYRTI